MEIDFSFFFFWLQGTDDRNSHVLQTGDPAPPDPPNQSQIQAPTDLVSLIRASNPPGGLYVVYPAVMFMSSEKRRFQVSLFLLLNYKVIAVLK